MNWHREIAGHIESIYRESNETFSNYQQQMGLPCLSGCGACCLSPEISATILEMLPTAFSLVDKNGLEFAEQFLQQLENSQDFVCVFYKRLSLDGKKGHCTNYEFRPSVCRSFGAAALRDKNGNKSMSICKYIKEAFPETIKNLDPIDAPVIGDFAKKITLLDPYLGNKLYPINEALKLALIKVLSITYFEGNRSA